MNILGIGDHVNCGAAILTDGTFRSVVNDERLVREKMVFGVPREGIKNVMEVGGVSPDRIDRVAIATVRQHLYNNYVDFRGGWFGLDRDVAKQFLFDLGSVAGGMMKYLPAASRLYYMCRSPFYAARRRALRQIVRDELGIHAPVQFVDHHYCHATSAYYSSGFDDALVVSIDGGGDGLSSRVYSVRDGRFEMLHKVPSFSSMGNLYAYITELCGFKAGKHEGKVTGLAAHGEPRYIDALQRIMQYRDGTFHNVAGVFFKAALKRIRSMLPAQFDVADLAASIQVFTEDVVTRYVTYWLDRSKQTNLALAGGLFANVAVNRKMHEIPCVDEIFIHPGMGDEGMPVGASLAAYYDHNPASKPSRSICMDHVYLGPGYSDEEIRQALESAGVAAKYFEEDVECEIARLLAKGHVVARFHGRMEYGPRALGNRSILYRPDDPSVNKWLNEALKRTEFMPFAPATSAEEAPRCFLNLRGAENAARFMTITFECTQPMREKCPGVVHIDGTARPQIVSRQDNPSFYRIIHEYQRLTGLPCIINTSFNMHEEPIVCTPADAIRAFQLGHLDYLAIGRWLARNPQPIYRPAKESVSEQSGVALEATSNSVA